MDSYRTSHNFKKIMTETKDFDLVFSRGENIGLQSMRVTDIFKNLYTKQAGQALRSLKDQVNIKTVIKHNSRHNSQILDK